MRALWRSSLLGIPASTLLALILGGSVPVSRRVVFVVFVSLADVASMVCAGYYLRRRRTGTLLLRYPPGLVCMMIVAVAWASPALFALPRAHDVELRAVYLLFVCATSATWVVGTAARRLYFYASQIPLLLIVSLAFALSGDRVTRLLGLSVPIYFIVMASLHHEVHGVVVSELQLREHNDETNAQLRDANAQLVRRALRDELTGLANRAAFVDLLQRAVGDAREHGTIVGVLYFDVDRLKVVNDSLGHATGDMLLVQIAERVHRMLRTTDVLARLGGDEFTMLLDKLRSNGEALVIAERVAQAFVEPFAVGGRSINVSASIGVATNREATDDAETLLSFADAAQYRAKQSGRNRIEVFDMKLRAAIESRLDDEHALRDAIAKSRIVAYYQPEVDLLTGRFVGAEALARWEHSERGVLDAGKFVPLAEETGLVFGLDDAIVADAVATRVALAASGVVPDDFRIWCNVSATHLTRGMPTRELAALLEHTGCDPNLIGLEITETAVLPDVAAAAREIAAARKLGIKVALDDFGTGHSSLTLLRSLTIDRVKIDRTFITECTRDSRDAAIVRRVIGLAQDLGLDVVAEGVETPEQARLLVELGCPRAQGWLFAKALPIAELRTRLDEQRQVAAVAGELAAAPGPARRVAE
ncbi:MAG: diguanylate cyclase/phosphodiesterase with and sensor(s) [Actinomycetia bacterium]|jgi:diguanylate cyclase (GGDEF)-like protein|nr:diguanylate cyclase/phosphodiesterase with and sensor(s) [Actinomycetes bacterium]